MSAPILSMQIAGFKSVANSGNPATGAQLLGSKAISFWDDGSLTFTDAAGLTQKIDADVQLNKLLRLILTGATGFPADKTWFIG